MLILGRAPESLNEHVVQLLGSSIAAGMTLQLTKVQGDKVALGSTNSPKVLHRIKPGDEVQVDTSNFLAVQTYHRH